MYARSLFLVAKLQTFTLQHDVPTQWLLCDSITYDRYKHIVCVCPAFTNEREHFVYYITNTISVDIGRFLRQTDLETFYCCLLGAKPHAFAVSNDALFDRFMANCIAFVSIIVREYNRHLI